MHRTGLQVGLLYYIQDEFVSKSHQEFIRDIAFRQMRLSALENVFEIPLTAVSSSCVSFTINQVLNIQAAE